jgi:peptidyl-prolyl cis-trans isomerase D
MMQWIRGRAGSIIVKILFGLLIISFGFWGIYTRSAPPTADTVVATVGGESIRADALQRALPPVLERLRAQYGASIDAQQLKQLGILDRLLDQLIERSLLDQEAQRLGLEVSDEAIRGAIYDNPAFRGPDGKFDRSLFARALAVNRMSEDQVVAQLRHEIPRSDLLQVITAGVGVPRPVVDALYRYRNEKRLADIVAFPVSAVTDIAPPSEADLSKFHDSHPEMFRAPEYRGITVASLSPADLEPAGDIPDDKLKKEYDQRKDEFETPERREIQQILSPSEEKAKEAAAAIASGKEWHEVATTLAGQDRDTVDLGLLTREEIPHELGDVAFDLPLNQPSPPIKSPLGWHLLRVVRIEPGATQSFDAAKPQIAAELKLQDAADRVAKIGNEADDALAGGAPLTDVAAKYRLKTMTVAAIDENGHDPQDNPITLPVASDEVLKSVFTTNQGETSRIIDTKDGAIFAINVDKVIPPQVRPLAEVKDKAVAAWQAEQKKESATKEAEALAAAVTPDVTLAKVAGDKRLTVLPTAPLSRGEQKDQTVPPALVAKLFAAKPGDVVTVTEATGAYTAQLKEIQPPEAISEAAATGLSDQLAGEARAGVAGQFTEALRQRFRVEIQREVLDRMF